MPNRLSHATSPYLRQHENNPVDWYPWGDEAFARARDEGKPVLLSIGYSACHWCHVMAHESFEDPATAALQNELYVNIKVDREEHPDVDQIYQLALQLTGENGGWPLTMWLLPDGRPFFGGTYFPPDDRHGRASFTRVLRALADAYRDQRPKVEEAANELRRGLRNLAELPTVAPGRAVPKDGVDRAAFQLAQRMDRERGGFAGAPKFPNVTSKLLLLRAADRARRRGDVPRSVEQGDAVLNTLDHMIAGGIYDQLGGGFHRYSTDADWLVPHFEKMLYDQGLLLRLLAEAYTWRTTPRYAEVIRQTAAYLERDMRSPEGGLYTAEDADSEGLEGKYYVWTRTEVAAICGTEAAALIARIYDVRDGGNWSDPHGHGPVGASILRRIAEPANEAEAAELARAEAKLLAARQSRVRPLCDDKLLASSNGLALAGLAEAARVLGDASLLASARRTAEFLLTHMRDAQGRMYRVKQTGSAARLAGTLDDHAFVADGMIALYEASGEGRWLHAAFELTKLSLALFYDEKRAIMFLTAASDETLVVRPLSFHDSAIPSGLAVTVQNLLRLGAASGDRALLTAADRLIESHADRALTQPFGLSQFVSAIDLQQRGCSEIVLAGDDTSALERAVASVYLPNRLIARVTDAPSELASLCEGKAAASSGDALAYVCRNFACERPEGDPRQLVVRLAEAQQ